MSEDKPNVVLLVIDSLRADHLGCYGYDRNTSPFLDKLAEEGQKFSKVYANANWSTPSHASLFTGELPSDHGMDHQGALNFKHESNLKKFFKAKGYQIEGVSNNPYISQYYGFEKIFDDFELQLWSGIMDEETEELLHYINQKDWASQKHKYQTIIKKAALQPKTLGKLASYKLHRLGFRNLGLCDSGVKSTLSKIEKSLESDTPKFIFANLMEVHEPYVPPIKYKRRFSNQYKPKDGIFNTKTAVKGEKLKQRIDLYDDCIRYIDGQIKKFYEEIQRKENETILIVTSDHGELFLDNSPDFEDSKQGHQPSLSEELLNVPFIVSKSTKINSEEPFSLKELTKLLKKELDGENINFENPISECFPKNGDVMKRISNSKTSCYKVNEKIYPKIPDDELLEELENRSSKIKKEDLEEIDI
jgi:arylsulfatase A-like enzyme